MSKHHAVFVENPDVEIGHEDEHPSSFVRSAHPDVVELGAVTQREAATGVDAIMTDLGVGQDRLAVDDDGGLVERSPGLHGWASPCGVGALFVVDVDEAVDLGLEVGQGGDGSDGSGECSRARSPGSRVATGRQQVTRR